MSFSEGVRVDPGRARQGSGRGGLAVGGGVGGLVVLVLALVLGVDPSVVTGGGAGTGGGDDFSRCTTGQAANADVDCRVIATAESLDAVWGARLPDQGVVYAPPGLVLFSGATTSACGTASAQTGPFYCPPDASVYLDTEFFDVLVQRYGASAGPLAQEYVVAHEFGHAVQDQLGVLGAAQDDPSGPGSGAVRVELQADCLAGIWAHDASTTPDPDSGLPFLQPLTDADVADALSAAASVGDDRVQQQATGQVVPEAFTHGTSAQRQRWFTAGWTTGDVAACDTFATDDLG